MDKIWPIFYCLRVYDLFWPFYRNEKEELVLNQNNCDCQASRLHLPEFNSNLEHIINLEADLFAVLSNSEHSLPDFNSSLFDQIIGVTPNLGAGVFAVLSTIGIQCCLPDCPIGKHLPYTRPPILLQHHHHTLHFIICLRLRAFRNCHV